MMELIERIPPWLWITLIVHGAVLGTVAYLILLERKVASWVQDRIGPNRVGPMGLLQPIADGLKFILKEDYRPGSVDKYLFTLAPMIMIAVVIVSIAVIPWGGTKQTTREIDITDAVHGTEGIAKVEELDAVRDRIPWGAQIVSHNVTMHGDDRYGSESRIIATVVYRYDFQIARINIGVLFILAVLSLAVYGVVIGGWASNNKYSFLGGLRATANMISYEIPLGLAVLAIVVLFGTLDLGEIVTSQAHYWLGFIPAWNAFNQPVTFLMFLVCIHAEANRAPFDLAEAEQELVGGYHTEYSSMRFALFFLAEYAGMITTSAVCVCLFFGGWHLPWIEWVWPAIAGNVNAADPSLTTSLIACIVRAIVLFAKTGLILFVFMWVRWSLPRFRFDQLMMTAWRALIPMSLALLVVTSIVLYVFGPRDELYRSRNMLGGWFSLALLAGNVFVIAGFFVLAAMVPAAPATNRRIKVQGSRFDTTPLPAGNAV